MTVRDALNSALDEEMSADPKVFLMGEEVGRSELYLFVCLFLKWKIYVLWDLCSFCSAAYLVFLYVQVGEYQGAYKVWFSYERDEFV